MKRGKHTDCTVSKWLHLSTPTTNEYVMVLVKFHLDLSVHFKKGKIQTTARKLFRNRCNTRQTAPPDYKIEYHAVNETASRARSATTHLRADRVTAGR